MIRKRKPTKKDHLIANLLSWLSVCSAVDISPGMEKYLCVSRSTLLRAAKSLCEDPADFNQIMILRFGKNQVILATDEFRLSDFDLRFNPKGAEITDGSN